MADNTLSYGTTPGLRFACLLDGRGGCKNLDWDGVRKWQAEDGVLWVHLERDEPAAQAWLKDESGIDSVIVEALLADDTRPRVDEGEDALLVFLRGVNRQTGSDPVELVPIHVWVNAQRLISLRDRNNYLLALRDIRESLNTGKGPRTVGDLFVQIAEKIVKYVDPVLNELDDEADRLDENCVTSDGQDWRQPLASIRQRTITLRRYLAPQREALFRLQIEDVSWLGRRDRVHLREITDKVLRYVDGLDMVRDRTTILHEDLTAQIAERIALTSNRLTGIAALFLPPSLVAGMLGMNLAGIPAHDHDLSFLIVCAVIIAIMALEYWVLRRLRWI